MHLTPPMYNPGKRKGKPKFRDAASAQRARELDESWKQLQAKWEVDADEKKRARALAAPKLEYSLSTPHGRSSNNHIPSLNSGDGIASSKPSMQYTGDKMLGITIVHKSCLQPVFSQEAAIDAANMRR